VSRALGFQKSAAPRVKLGSILLTWDLIDEGSLLKALANLHHCEIVSGDTLINAPAEVVRMLPATHAIRLNAAPYALQKARICVAFVNPSDIAAVDEVSSLTGHVCVPAVVTELRLFQAHRRFYGRAIPFELRPMTSRGDSSRLSRSETADAASSLPKAIPIPVVAGPPPSGDGIELSPITVPDLPIPPPLTTGQRGVVPVETVPPAAAAASAPPPVAQRDGSDMWIATRVMPAETEAVRTMWSHATAAATPAVSRDELGDLALGTVPSEFPRALLLTDRDGALVGWRGRGLASEKVEAIRLAETEPSVFASVVRSGAPHFGRVEPDLWPEAFAGLLDGPVPCAIFPLQSGHGVVAVLYADRRGAPMKHEDTTLLARAAAEIAALLARIAPGSVVPSPAVRVSDA
jgi:hypothetical protein